MESSVKRKIENYCAYQERCHSEVKRKLNSLGVFGKDVDEYLYYLIDENFLSETRFGPLLGSSRRLAFSEFDFEDFEILNFVWALIALMALIR